MRTTLPGSWRWCSAATPGAELLDTYDAERRPVGTFTTEQAYSRYVTRTAPYLGTDGMQPVAPDLNVELGYRYDSPAICHDGDPGPLHENPRESHARRGHARAARLGRSATASASRRSICSAAAS